MKKRSFISIKQNPIQGNYRSLRNDQNSLIHWNEKALDIYNKVRAISKPYPGAFYISNRKKIRVWKSKILNIKLKKKYMPGEIIKINNNIKSKIIMTKDYPIRIYE